MMLSSCLLSFFLLFAICNGQSLTRLKDLRGDNTVNVIHNGATLIYFTATSDKPDLLKQINFKNSGTTYTAYDLTQRRESLRSDLLIPWSVSGITTVTTTLSDSDMMMLTGSIYCTSAHQAIKGKINLLVYDITQNQKVVVDKSIGNATIVILNSQFLRYPKCATTIYNWNQPEETSVRIYEGYPLDTVEQENTQIFSNPVNTLEKPIYIDSVEDFVVTLGCFYLRIEGTGGLKFNTSLRYKDIDQSRTKSVRTTGFYMKSYNENPTTKTIYPMRDTAYNGFTGANLVGDLTTKGDVYIETSDDEKTSAVSFPPAPYGESGKIRGWMTPNIGNTLTISSNNTYGGQFFVQYYIHQENRI